MARHNYRMNHDKNDQFVKDIFSQMFGEKAADEMARIKHRNAEAEQSKHVKDFLRHLYDHNRKSSK